MIQSGKHFEGIVEMLNNFRSEIKSLSSLGYLNINKYSENFLKRILNFVYEIELENLNEKQYNFPGLDLGDEDESIAFQITAKKKSSKIDDTLQTCINHKHYEIYKKIKVLILTSKQNSYKLKTVTEPHFTFDPNSDILDFDDLYKIIEELEPRKLKSLFDFLQEELQLVIESLNSEEKESRSLLETEEGIKLTNLKNFFKFSMHIELQNQKASTPNIYTIFDSNLKNTELRNSLLPIFNPQFRDLSTNQEILFEDKFSPTSFSNIAKGKALLIGESKIQMELVDYSDQNLILTSLYSEFVSLITNILLIKKCAKGNYELKIVVSMDNNKKVCFHPPKSIILQNVFNTYSFEKSFLFETVIENTRTATLLNLIQEIAHAFISKDEIFVDSNPFLKINKEFTSNNINTIKESLGEKDYDIR
jgi:hypothetical protein